MFRSTLSVARQAASASKPALNPHQMALRKVTEEVLISHLKAGSLPMQVARTRMNVRKSLFQLLSTQPLDGVGAKVRSTEWTQDGIEKPKGFRQVAQNVTQTALPNQAGTAVSPQKPAPKSCYYTVTSSSLTKQGTRGEVWGLLTWKNKTKSEPERIVHARSGSWELAQ